MSPKVSTETVDNRPYWRQKLEYFRDGVIPSNVLVGHFEALRSPRDPNPLTVELRIPTIAERVAEFTRLGRPEGYYDDLEDDDFEDHLDDLPEEGLSPHEDPSFVHRVADAILAKAAKADKKPVEKKSDPGATPPAAEGGKAPTQPGEPSAAPADAGKK